MINITVPGDSKVKKKKYENLGKYHDLKEELERMWKVKEENSGL